MDLSFYAKIFKDLNLKTQSSHNLNNNLLPYAQKRKTTLYTRQHKLEKKIKFYTQKYQINTQSRSLYQIFDMPHKINIYITYLEIITFLYKQLEKNILHIKEEILVLTNNSLLYPDINKKTLYSTQIGISLKYAFLLNKQSFSAKPTQKDIYSYISKITLFYAPIFYYYNIIILYHNFFKLPNSYPIFIIDMPLAYLNLINGVLNMPTKPNKKLKLSNILPKFYYKPSKLFFISKQTQQGLANFIKSNKRSKKYLRILHKRLKIYTHKKPKWKTIN